MAQSSGEFVFRPTHSIGAMAAEDDSLYLESCFVDKHYVAELLDVKNPRRIILGRTGSGKSALLLEMKKRAESHGAYFISLVPADLSLNYISNSQVLQRLDAHGVNLDPFFKLLWKHFFAIAVFEKVFPPAPNDSSLSIWDRLSAFVQSLANGHSRKVVEKRQKAVKEYIEKFGGKFFCDHPVRVKQIVSTFESQAEAKGLTSITFGAKAGPVELSSRIDNGDTVTGKRTDVVTQEVANAQSIIGDIHNHELAGVLELVGDVLPDEKKPCYIVLDKLDESWAEDCLRLRLLKALITTIGDIREQHNTKVVICLRIDLLDRIFAEMGHDSGFQEEKVRSYYRQLSWSDAELTELLNLRIKKLMKDAWTNYQPKAEDIFVADSRKKHKAHSGLQYLLDRTWGRPRDVIDFFNSCIEHCDGKTRFDKTVVRQAEGEYSRRRLNSIGTEWGQLYPGIRDGLTVILANTPHSFRIADIDDDRLDRFAEVFCEKYSTGPLIELAHRMVNASTSESTKVRNSVRIALSHIFYRIGAIGLKLSAKSEVQVVDNYLIRVSDAELSVENVVVVHKALWRALGTDTRD